MLVGREYINANRVVYMQIPPQSPMQGREWFEVPSGISERVVTHVRQCHIPDAERVELSQDRDRISNLVSSVQLLGSQ